MCQIVLQEVGTTDKIVPTEKIMAVMINVSQRTVVAKGSDAMAESLDVATILKDVVRKLSAEPKNGKPRRPLALMLKSIL